MVVVTATGRREFLSMLAASAWIPEGRSVREDGAAGDGKTLDTTAIQKAIDGCAESGGGYVFFPPGEYLTGTLELRKKVRLSLAPGATILGSKNLDDYPKHEASFRSYTDNYTERCLIRAERVSDVGIVGAGAIDGQGAAFSGGYKLRPYLLRFVECAGVTVSGVRLLNSPMWVQHYLACDDVYLTGVTVRSRVNGNNDGIDIDSCRRVRISDCDISSGDDAICLKSTSDRVCSDVTVTNCVVSSHCNAIKLGTETNGGFRNINITGCALYDTRLAGIALEIVDGGVLEGVVVSDVTMRDVKGPIFVRLGDRGRPFRGGDPKPPPGKLGGVRIRGVQATGGGQVGCSITGLAGAPVQRVALSDVSIEFDGGGTLEDAARQPVELPDAYPEFTMFKTLPSYGFFCRNVDALSMTGVRLSYAKPDQRPALVFDRVRGARLRDVEAQASDQAPAAAVLRDTQDVQIRDCGVFGGGSKFMKDES